MTSTSSLPDETVENVALLELAERCEKATGPDRELDLAIATASYERGFPVFGERVNYDPALWLERYGPISGSLDAAMTLVPEGWSVTVVRIPGFPSEAGVLEWQQDDKGRYWRPANGADSGKCKAATPALALCAAALRARAIKDTDHG